MSGNVCKFCGAAFACEDNADGVRIRFSCGSYHQIGDDQWEDGWIMSHGCCEAIESRNTSDLARFRSMFPTIIPDDPREITADICEALGMVLKFAAGTCAIWCYEIGDDNEVLWSEENGAVITELGGGAWCQTAGQLACLIAARKNPNEKGLKNASASGS